MEDCPRARSGIPCVKLNPRKMMGNPVMFVVEVGSVITTALLLQGGDAISDSTCRSRSGCGSRCCSRTSPKRWRKAAARRRPTLCAKRAPKPWPIACCPTAQTETGAELQAARWRHGRRGSGRVHSRRRRDRRRRRLGGRVGHHRRVRARDPRGRRRPLGRHRRHARALRPDQGQDHCESGRNFPRPHDRAGRRRRAAEDAERDRAEHPAGGTDDHLPAGSGHACSHSPFIPVRRRPCLCWSRCWSA